MENRQYFIVSSSPHIHSGYSIPVAMRDVICALVPAILASVYFFGIQAALVILVSIFTAVLTEYLCQKVMQRKVTINDGSAALTGLLLAMCLPPKLSLWMAALGSVFAIVIGKQVFGGLGCNVFNPAHIGRAILLASFPAQMTTWTHVSKKMDALSSATPLDAVSSSTPLMELKILEKTLEPAKVMLSDALPGFYDLFIGNVGGSLGETCVPALLIGGIYLIWRGHINWRIPVMYLASVYILMASYALFKGYDLSFAFYHLLGGGLFIGAFFMATDWVTSPLSNKGKIIFALGLGFLTCLIRLKSSYSEGVCYSILLMNMLTHLIDRYTRRRVFGRDAK